jgi:hypothetical protein
MHHFLQKTAFVLFSAYLASAAAAQSVQEMSEAERQATGVAKLSASELAALQAWMDAKRSSSTADNVEPRALTAPAPRVNVPSAANDMGQVQPHIAPDNFVPPGKSEKRLAFDATLAEPIRQLSGKTRIRLSNGQVWQQADGFTWSGSLSTLEVRVKPKIAGSYLMQFKANNMSVRVKRIQ